MVVYMTTTINKNQEMPAATEHLHKSNTKTLNNIYKKLPEKYKSLLYQDEMKRANNTDVAHLVLTFDEQVLGNLLCFAETKETKIYMPNESGIWREQFNNFDIINNINDVRIRIEKVVIDPVKDAFKKLERKSDTPEYKRVKAHLDDLKKLYSRLGMEAFKKSVIKEILAIRKMKTTEIGLNLKIFDTQSLVLGFDDGVYDFSTRKLMSNVAAHHFYLTRTVGYEFNELMNIDPNTYQSYQRFMAQVLPNPGIRQYFLKMMSNAAQGKATQSFLIHYNLSGSNGKTTLFSLVKLAFGETFMKCNCSVLYPPTYTSTSGSNEELMSVKGMRIVLFSEPSSMKKLHTSFIKELTGNDEQSTRANYGSKETFKFMGVPHILCNKIPELDEVDGGIERRLKCIPYESRFVDDPSQVDESSNIYLRDMCIDKNFKDWKYCLMKDIIEMADVEVPEPAEVIEHTKDLLQRENLTKAFIDECIEKTDNMKDIIKMKDVYRAYTRYCKSLDATALKAKFLKEELITFMDNFIAKSQGNRNIWRGYKLRPDELYEFLD